MSEMYSSELLVLIGLKRLLYKHRAEIIEDLELEAAISCPDCIIGNSESGCYKYCCGCCQCNHNECDNCDMSCHSYLKLNDKCRCNCDHFNCNTEDSDNEEYCNGACHEECKYLSYINGDKNVVAILLKKALSKSDKLFNKYNNLLNPNDKYYHKPYELTLSQYYTN